MCHAGMQYTLCSRVIRIGRVAPLANGRTQTSDLPLVTDTTSSTHKQSSDIWSHGHEFANSPFKTRAASSAGSIISHRPRSSAVALTVVAPLVEGSHCVAIAPSQRVTDTFDPAGDVPQHTGPSAPASHHALSQSNHTA